MAFDGLRLSMRPLPGTLPLWHARTEADRLAEVCRAAASQGGRLAALWGSDDRIANAPVNADSPAGFNVHLILANRDGALWLTASLPAEHPVYPDLSSVFPYAKRQQRALADLLGIQAANLDPVDLRPWLRHGAWRADQFPLRHDSNIDPKAPLAEDPYAFVRVEGDGVHEIPVGPVHAGIIEPGHFRFSIVGEKVLRLEERLGYKHKGIERKFSELNLQQGARLAGRISGDSTVAYAWAYAMAYESTCEATPPMRATWLRALFLERERIANHLGDLGALGNDGGLAFGLTQFMRLKEDVLRLNARIAGHRYLMDTVIPGGVSVDLDRAALGEIIAQCDVLDREVHELKMIYDDHAGLQDRFTTCGILEQGLARELGVVGFAARASGEALDARCAPGYSPYDLLDTKIITASSGDVGGRVAVRFGEILESTKLIRAIAERINPGRVSMVLPTPVPGTLGLGWVEGWRGEVFIALQVGENGRIHRAHGHDPSWQNWPALEHAVLGNIVPDFPLINKSFNLSYAGHDL